MTNYEESSAPFLPPNLAEGARLAPEVQAIVDEVAAVDAELLESPETRRLVEIGAAFILEVTQKHGSPDAPKWYAGTADETMMVYHNGESEAVHGHTSAGANGVGVPRNALMIALGINARAAREVIPPIQRALLFASGAAHDVVQLCGRSIAVPNGDEQQSAQRLYNTLLESGFTEAIAQEGARYVMATMYDPIAARHVIVTDEQPFQTVLGQQIMAAADLLSPATERGALGSMEWTLEEFGLELKGQVLQTELVARGLTADDIPDLPTLLALVDATPALKQRFVATLRGQAGWIEGLSYSDDAIRAACGAGIDDMFAGRPHTAAMLRLLAGRAEQGASLRDLWQSAGASYIA